MKELLVIQNLSLADPNEGSAGGTGEAHLQIPVGATLVYASGSPRVNDADATFDIQDDGTDIVTGVDVSDADAPGEWATEGYGGTNDPVSVASGSVISIDLNNAANGNRFDIQLWFLTGV